MYIGMPSFPSWPGSERRQRQRGLTSSILGALYAWASAIGNAGSPEATSKLAILYRAMARPLRGHCSHIGTMTHNNRRASESNRRIRARLTESDLGSFRSGLSFGSILGVVCG